MKRIFIAVIVLVFATGIFAQYRKPNVLFIAIDDMRPELNCYGKSQIISPTIDQIASEGIVFTRAYCQVALCGPSRLSIMTGMHPDRLKNYGMSATNKIEWRDHRPGITSLPQQFRNNGYYSIGFGKIYDNRLGLDIGYSWDSFTQGWKGKYVSPRAIQILEQADADIAAGNEPDIIRPAVDFYDTPDETYTDGNNAKLAVDFIKYNNSEAPYFLAVGFSKPHLPFVAPKKYWDLYNRDSIMLPEFDVPPEKRSEYMLSPYKEIESYINKSIIDEDKIKELRHGYYACVSYVDAQIAKIINALDEKGELDNTIIIIWGDHGFKLGDYGEWAKATNLEVDARVPLILRLPGNVGAGIRSSALVELTDVLPTVCKAAHLPIPEGVEGNSLLPVACQSDVNFRDFALTQYRRSGNSMGYSIRTKEWRYCEWINPQTGETNDKELYKMDDETLMEKENVEELYPDTLENLSKMLHNYLDTAEVFNGEIIPDFDEKRGGYLAYIKMRIMNLRRISLLIISMLMTFACSNQGTKSETMPNIIYILADDLGYGDLSFLGQVQLKTPNIDRLASQGMSFTEHYAGSAVCGPSRCVLMTGQHTGHASIRGNKAFEGIGVAPLEASVLTLPEAIKKNTNYTTAMCGRWHLGGELSDQTPFDRGFDYHFGKLSSDYPNKFGVLIDTLWDEDGLHVPYEAYSNINVEPMYENGKLFNLSEKEMTMRPINKDELVTDKAIRYINKEKNQPFFLYIAYSLVHAPMEYQDKYPLVNKAWPENERAFASMLTALDDYVGRILIAINEAGIRENTIVIFTSDNGAHNEGHDVNFFDSNGIFREYKRSFLEGGFHTPMIVRWPGVVQEGSTSAHISAFWDVMPTFCDIAGAPIPDQTDGISFLPELKGEKQEEHDYLYWEFNESITHKKNEFKQAIRKGDLKGIYYIEKDLFELYNLKNDISEQNNIAGEHQDIVSEMRKFMSEAHVPSERFPLLKSERQHQ